MVVSDSIFTFPWKSKECQILILGIFLVMGTVEMLPPTIPSSVTDDSICNTEACEKTATLFLSNMDKSVDPCDNFYQYACGNFINKTELPEDEDIVDYENILSNDVREQLNRSLNANSTKDEKMHKLLQNLYQSCMNTEKIEAIGLHEIAMKIKNLGGWPVVERDTWNDTDFDLNNAIFKSRQFRYIEDAEVISASVKFTQPKVMEQYFVYIVQPLSFDFITFDYERLEDNDEQKEFKAYLNYTIAIAEAFGAHRDRAGHEMLQALQFQRDFINIISESPKGNISIVEQNSSIIPWIGHTVNQRPMPVGDNTTVFYMDSNWISGLELLLARTPKRTIANYLILQIIKSVTPFLNNQLRALKYAFEDQINAKSERSDRWEECFVVTKLLPMARSSVYVQDHFDQEMSNDILDIASHVKRSYVDLFKRSNEMDYKSKIFALAKLATLSIRIGYLERLSEIENLKDYYNGLELFKDSYLENILNIYKFNRAKNFAAVEKSADKNVHTDFWSETVIGAAYNVTGNVIRLTAGYLQDIIFTKDRPKYVNYGTLGFTFGHEISHAFESRGVNFDAFGNQMPWLTESTNNSFFERIECVAEQYSNYTIKKSENNENGKTSLQDDIADILGVKIAYKAYKQWVKENGEEQRLPGIDRSPEQLFWLSMANVWCSKAREGVLYTEHSPPEFRIIGSLSSSREFAEDYKCPEGSKMNPIKKCTIW